MADQKALVFSPAGQTQQIQTGDVLTAPGTFASSTTTAILATTSAGSVALRPNGSGSATGQMSLASSGNATFNGNNCIVESKGAAGFGSFAATASGTNASYLFFNNATGERARLTSTDGSVLQIGVGTGATTQVAIDAIRAQFTNAIRLTPSTAPAGPSDGDLWYDSGAAKFRKREAGVTTDIGAVAASGTVTTVTSSVGDGVTIGITNPTTTPNLTVDLGLITPTGINVVGGGLHGDITGSGSTNTIRIGTPAGLGSVELYPDGLSSSTGALSLSASAAATLGGAININSGWLNVASGTSVTRNSTPAAGNNSTEVATTAYVRSNVGMANYRVLLDRTGSHIAARTAAHYAIPQGNACATTGVGTLYSQGVFYFDPADYPTIDTVTAKLRLRGQVFVNDVAPTGNFIIGMYPVTRPATSGGAGLVIYTLGAVTAVCTTITAPAADSSNTVTSSDFAMPAAGYYCLGVQTTATVAASSHLHINAQLQMRHA